MRNKFTVHVIETHHHGKDIRWAYVASTSQEAEWKRGDLIANGNATVHREIRSPYSVGDARIRQWLDARYSRLRARIRP